MARSLSRPRDVRAIAIARLISEMGDEIALIALLFRVKSSGAAAISAIFALYALSRIVLSPFTGTIVDVTFEPGKFAPDEGQAAFEAARQLGLALE